MKCAATIIILLAAAAQAARADEVVLRNGARFEGQVKESGDTVTVVMDFGSMTFKKIDVAKIDRGPSALAEFDAKVLNLKADDLAGKYHLAMWAGKKGLSQRARNLFEDILERHPDHAGAREALGFKKVGERWLSEEEVKAEQGLVKFRGDWMSRETRDEIHRIEAERQTELARIAAEEAAQTRILQAEAAEIRRREDAQRAWEEARFEDRRWFNDYYASAPVYPTYGFVGGLSCGFRKPIHMGNAAFIPAGGGAPCVDKGGAPPVAAPVVNRRTASAERSFPRVERQRK